MAICPHCGKRANPLEPSLYVTYAPYRCPSCKKKSAFARRELVIVVAVAIFVGVLLKMFLPFNGWLNLAVATAASVAFIAVIGLFMKLRPEEEPNQPSKTTTGKV